MAKYTRRSGQSAWLDDVGMGDFRDEIPTPAPQPQPVTPEGLAVIPFQRVKVEFSDGTVETIIPLNDRIIGSYTAGPRGGKGTWVRPVKIIN